MNLRIRAFTKNPYSHILFIESDDCEYIEHCDINRNSSSWKSWDGSFYDFLMKYKMNGLNKAILNDLPKGFMECDFLISPFNNSGSEFLEEYEKEIHNMDAETADKAMDDYFPKFFKYITRDPFKKLLEKEMKMGLSWDWENYNEKDLKNLKEMTLAEHKDLMSELKKYIVKIEKNINH